MVCSDVLYESSQERFELNANTYQFSMLAWHQITAEDDENAISCAGIWFQSKQLEKFNFFNCVDIAIVHEMREHLDLLVAQEQIQQRYLDYFSHLTLVEIFMSEFGGPCVRPGHQHA